jgi:hypothetical protein
MELRTVNAVLLVGFGTLLLASGTQHEHPLLSEGQGKAIGALEADYATHKDAASLAKLAQGYVDAEASGYAVSVIESAPTELQSTPVVQHSYARALLDSGRAQDALAAEHRTLDMCATVLESNDQAHACDTWLIASATRRADIIQQLVDLGVEDAQAHPEQSAIAYQNATREAHIVVR